jgi:hypothetical protein
MRSSAMKLGVWSAVLYAIFALLYSIAQIEAVFEAFEKPWAMPS